jgi:DNA primase large subunit
MKNYSFQVNVALAKKYGIGSAPDKVETIKAMVLAVQDYVDAKDRIKTIIENAPASLINEAIFETREMVNDANFDERLDELTSKAVEELLNSRSKE